MGYFSSIYADDRLPHRAKAVYMYLKDRSDREGRCWPGVKTIAKDLRLSTSTVKRAVADLVDHGYLEKENRYRENGGQSSNLYTLKQAQPPAKGSLRPFTEPGPGSP